MSLTCVDDCVQGPGHRATRLAGQIRRTFGDPFFKVCQNVFVGLNERRREIYPGPILNFSVGGIVCVCGGGGMGMRETLKVSAVLYLLYGSVCFA